jgi:hypothetical protein
VIPIYDVTPRSEVQPTALKALTPRLVVDGFSVVRDYEPQIEITWEEAIECLTPRRRGWIGD